MATGTNRIEEIFGDARSQADALEMLAQERSRNAAKEAQGDEAGHRVLLCWPGPTRSRSGLLRPALGYGCWTPWTKPCGKPACCVTTTAGINFSTGSASTTVSGPP